MKKFLTLMGLGWLCFMPSCSSDQDPAVPDTHDPTPTVTHMKVKFNDRIYETDVLTDGDEPVYLNEEYTEVYRTKIANDPDIAAVLSSDDSGTTLVEYFPSEKSLIQKYSMLPAPEIAVPSAESFENLTRGGLIDMFPSNRTGVVIGEAHLFDDRNFKDTELVVYACCSWATEISRLKDIGFNDKASSIKVYNKMTPSQIYTITAIENDRPVGRSYWGSGLRPVLVCYQDSDFKGNVLYCIAPPTGTTDPHADTNLKSIGWNDKISSTQWVTVYNFSDFTGNPPNIPAHDPC